MPTPLPSEPLPSAPDRHLGDRLRLLRAITAPEGGTFEHRLQRALALTTSLLGFDVGILSQIVGERYTVVSCHAPGTELVPGSSFPLGDTYCSLMLSTGDLLSIGHMARSEHRRHPCYGAFRLESYAGLPVFRGNAIWGTLNVSAAAPRDALTEADEDLLRVLASWIGGELERDDLVRTHDAHDARLRAVLAKAPMILFAFDAEGTVTLSTGGGLALLGLDDGEVVGMNIRDFNDPGSAAASGMADALRGTPSTWRSQAMGVHFETTAEPIRDAQGAVVGGIAVSTDISERARAEAAHRESESRYRTLSAATSEGIAFSRDGVIFDANHQLAALFGFDAPEALVGRAAGELVHPDHIDDVLRRIRANSSIPYETVCVRQDGTPFWAEVKGQPIEYGGETVRMTAIRDISQQKEALAQTRFQADVLRHVSDAVIALDLDGRVTYWNAGAERIHGLSAEAMLGRRLDEVIRYSIDEDAHQQSASEPDSPSLFQDSDSFGHLVYVTPDGDRRCVSVSSSVLRDDDGAAKGMLAVVRDVTQQHEMAVQLRHQAYHDALTGLPNRAWFRVRIERAIERGRPFAVLFLDLDHFKVVNDSLGHDSGDQLLRSVALRLREALGASEGAVVSRLGGDEFAVLMPGRPDHAERMAQRVLQTLDVPIDLGPRQVSPAGSVGLVATASLYTETDDLLRDADTAMYVAKRSGRNQICVFDDAMHEQAKARFQMEQDLRFAIERDQLRLVLQPLVDLETGALAGMEALVRWAHPTNGLVSPGVFIPLAEEINMIAEIDRWMFRAACQEMASWRLGEAPFLLSVNCSDQTLLSDGLAAFVESSAREAGLAPDRVALELTERALIDATSSNHTLDRLREQGFRILVDDFGSGYSSLGLVHTLPVDGLKIDRSFVSDLEASPSARAVVRAVSQMTRDLGLRSVAEGIETPEQLARLRELGCPIGQGYLFARPVPPREARELVDAAPWQALFAAPASSSTRSRG